MKISIVTISYNQAQFLEKAILSITSQGCSNFEYIVVDPGSTDGSREIIEKHRSKINRVVLEKDRGAADGLNKGFSLATGEIYGFINSDDELLPNTLSRVAAFFKANPDVDVVSGCGYTIDADGKRTGRMIPTKLTPWLYVHGGVTIFQQGTFFRASCFNKVSGFNIGNKTCWDGELFLDMALAGAKFAIVRDDLANFRLHEGGLTGSGVIKKIALSDNDRLFQKVTGRKRGYFDFFLNKIARVGKYIFNLSYIPRRLLFISCRDGV